MMYSKGDVIVINFPFSDLINAKKRPMLVLAEKGEDIIGCAITSNPESDGIAIEFEEGSLPLKSKIKYWQIHTFLKGMATRKVARISRKTHNELLRKINELFQRNL
ncbi:type II toxin-antitoxin system PemK/MazF family toxin [Candidatus Woesearchaeota archaeon]|nr:type II toxin-antitoxin system PemK/MazF family toxin [Candidatus Woesearchaeota archaeon]